MERQLRPSGAQNRAKLSVKIVRKGHTPTLQATRICCPDMACDRITPVRGQNKNIVCLADLIWFVVTYGYLGSLVYIYVVTWFFAAESGWIKIVIVAVYKST